MALRKNDLDELNRPPQPRRTVAVRALPRAAGAEDITGNEDAEMGERTVADILLEQVQTIDGKLDDLSKNVLLQQGQTTLELSAIRRDVADLQARLTVVEQAPEKRRAQKARDETVWWQTTNGRINIVLALIVVASTVAPYIHISIGK